MHPQCTFKCSLLRTVYPGQVGLRRRKVHARSTKGAHDCRRQQVNCASLLPSSETCMSPLGSIFGHLPPSSFHSCWFRYPNRSKKCQSYRDTSLQIPISSVVLLGWRKFRGVHEHTKQLCLVGGHFYFSARG